MAENFDVIIVGAGISGIAAAHSVMKDCPARSFAVLEEKPALGGTWRLFRYPGVRSDSDMHTLGFSFYPWRRKRAIAQGAEIRDYLEETAKKCGIAPHICFNHKLLTAHWDSTTARWTLEVETPAKTRTALAGVAPAKTRTALAGVAPAKTRTALAGVAPTKTRTIICRFLIIGAGYYNENAPYQPAFLDQATFKGPIIHPQHWPEELDYKGKRIIVIGSGATAVSLVPALAQDAAEVVMLQRSPSHMMALSGDRLASVLRRILPEKLAARAIRLKNIIVSHLFYRWCKAWPEHAARVLRHRVAKAVGPEVDVTKHFTPRYAPWDQRLCFVPDGDLFTALRSGKARMVTDEIARFTPNGLMLASGAELVADIIITATGLNMELLSGITLRVDGQRVVLRKSYSYKGCMISGVPNLVSIFGYAHAAWTLKAELIARYATRLITHMEASGAAYAVPVAPEMINGSAPKPPLLSGYVLRAVANLPKQSINAPWHAHQNYFADTRALLRAPLDDGVLAFRQAEGA